MTFLTAASILFLWAIPTVKVTKYFGFFCRSCRFHNLWNSHKLGSWFTSQSVKAQMWKFMAFGLPAQKYIYTCNFWQERSLSPFLPQNLLFLSLSFKSITYHLNPIQHACAKGNAMTYLKEEIFKKPKQLTSWCGQQKHCIDDDGFYWTWLMQKLLGFYSLLFRIECNILQVNSFLVTLEIHFISF